MTATWDTPLYRRVHRRLCEIKMVDTHEHLQSIEQLPPTDEVTIGRLFQFLTSSDLISAGMPPDDMRRVADGRSGLSPRERWRLMAPWYPFVRNSAYFEPLRIAVRDLYGVEDFSEDTVDKLTEAMKREVRPGITRKVFDKANIDFCMNNPFGTDLVFRPCSEPEEFIIDMHDQFTEFPIARLAQETNIDMLSLDDYLRGIDVIFDRYASIACAYKIPRGYDRTLAFEDVPKHEVEKTFLRMLAFNDRPDRRELQALEDFILHYVCRKCGEHGLRMKVHCGHQEGNANIVGNARASLLTPLFLKYKRTMFDIYHISYPHWEEVASIVKTFPNVTVNFCFNWVMNPKATRHALSVMLDCVPVGKIHGFGGDYLYVEGSYGHAVIARREIARVLCEKVEEGRFTEEYAAEVGRMILRDNPLRNFDLAPRRERFRKWVHDTYGSKQISGTRSVLPSGMSAPVSEVPVVRDRKRSPFLVRRRTGPKE